MLPGLLSRSFLRLSWATLCLSFLLTATALLGQVPNLTDTTSTPLPNAGHAYLGLRFPADARIFGGTVSETVAPAVGAVSWRIGTIMPKGRGLTLPFAFAYDSSGAWHLESGGAGQVVWRNNSSYLAQGGWAYALPEISLARLQDVNGAARCDYSTDYMFQDPAGGRHAMVLSISGADSGAPSNSCQQTSPSRSVVTTGGEGPILATTQAVCSGCGFTVQPVTVTDADGTRYIFQHPDHEAIANGFFAELPDTVEDRNGNEETISDSGSGQITITDTLGRTALSTSGFGASGNTVTISGLSQPYTLTWGTVTASFSPGSTVLSGSCTVATQASATLPVITAITLPDGRQFQFSYDATYGLLSKVQLPTGGYVRYQWGLSSQAETGTFAGSAGSTCVVRYDVPVLTDRFVSYDGITEVLHQSFSYITSSGSGNDWTSKQTTLTQTDGLRSASFQTLYAYSGYAVPAQPNDPNLGTDLIAVEQSVTHKNWSGTTLRTEAMSWTNPRVLTSLQTTLEDNSTAKLTFGYDANEQQTEKDEYDFGAGVPGALTRVTTHAYGCTTGAHIVDLPTRMQILNPSRVMVAETDYGYDESTLVAGAATTGRDPAYAWNAGMMARCNQTSVTRIDSGGNIVTRSTFDDAGNPVIHTDGNGNTTSFAYDAADQGAYPTQVTAPDTMTGSTTVHHSTQMAYDFASGRMTSKTDVQNGTTITSSYNDPLGRMTDIKYPDGGETTYAFNGNLVETKRLISGSTWTDHFEHWDGVGQTDRAFTYNGSQWDTVDTVFDGEQQSQYVSSPYLSTGTGSAKATSNAIEPGDTSSFDALGRIVSLQHTDATTANTSYWGPDTTFTDEAGKQHVTIVDGLGRLIETKEIYDAKGDHYSTYYGYGLLDDLKSVTQGAQTRTYDYDQLNRRVDSTDPESGTTTFAYDHNNNLIRKQEANGTVISYGYDALNRLRSRSYAVSGQTAATPAVQVDYGLDSSGATTYDAYGHMTRVIAGGITLAMDQYDAMGRLETLDTMTGGNTYHTQISYDRIGAPVWEQYPSGRSLSLSNDREGRPYWVGDANGYAYLQYRNYDAGGHLSDEQFGNKLYQAVHYNARQQPTEVTLTDPNDHTNSGWRMDLVLGYTQTGVQAADNGSVVRLVDNLGSTNQSWTFGYDGLNRMTQWTSDSGGTNCAYSLDRYGNTSASGSNCGLQSGITFTASNQVTGSVYDAGGNLLSNTAGSNYGWDGNDEMVAFREPGQAGQYAYDGLERRVSATVNGVAALFLRDALGRTVGELSAGQWRDYVFAGGERLAEVVGAGTATLRYFHTDPLGTTRVISDQNGANLANCGQNPSYPNGSLLTYAPFGAEVGGCTQSATSYKFTAQRRDAESGLDHFRYRKYSPLTGRWLSPDPAGLQATCEKNPQTFNRYAYTLNSPATYRDRDGRFILWGDWPGYGGGWGWYPSWCQPDGFSISVDGIDLPQCPGLLIGIPWLIRFRIKCTCTRINVIPSRGTCSVNCSCEDAERNHELDVSYAAFDRMCGPLGGICPRYAGATKTFVDIPYIFDVSTYRVTGCIK